MTTKIGEILKLNIPEFIQGLKNLDEYLEVSGEIFDDLSDGIDKLKTIKHHGDCDDGYVDINLKELGFRIPVNINMSVKRQVLRDVTEMHIRRGTEDSVTILMRLIGIESKINKGWLMNPTRLRRGWWDIYNTDLTSRYTATDRMYLDLYYGETIEKEEGVYFRGYEYWDTLEEAPTKLLPIAGEEYDVVGSLGHDFVEATPYMVIRLEDSDLFLVDDKESIDPDTGEVYPYTLNEQFVLLEEIIEFFLIGAYRPTTMRIIVEGVALDASDEFNITEKFRLNTVSKIPPLNVSSCAEVCDNFTQSFAANKSGFNVGMRMMSIGQPCPVESRWWSMVLTVGQTSSTIVRETWDALETNHVVDQLTPITLVPLLGEATIENISVPNIQVYGVANGVETLIPLGYINPLYEMVKVTSSTPVIGKYMFKIKRGGKVV